MISYSYGEKLGILTTISLRKEGLSELGNTVLSMRHRGI